MAPTRRGFARLLARLDRAAFARFLAALWTARGADAAVVDGRVVVAGGPTLHPHAPPPGLPARLAARRAARAADAPAVDAVATTDPAVAATLRERGVDAVGPADLRRALLYDLDRATARGLTRDHLDHPLDRPVPSRGERVLAAAPGSDANAPLLVALVALVAAVALFAPGPLGPSADDAVGSSDFGGVVQPAAAGSPPPPGGAGGAGTGANASDGDTGRLMVPPNRSAADPSSISLDEAHDSARIAPGVTVGGVTDPLALARAHAAAVRGRSYEWVVSYREYTGGRRTTIAVGRTRTVRVANETRFSDEIRGWGDATDSPIPERRAVYAEGDSRYVLRRSDARNRTTTVDRHPLRYAGDDGDHYADRAARYVRWLLSPDETEVVARTTRDGAVYYRLSVRSPLHGDAADFRATAVVAPSGFVRELHAGYALPDRDRAVSVGFRYERLGGATVERPEWVPAARNASA